MLKLFPQLIKINKKPHIWKVLLFFLIWCNGNLKSTERSNKDNEKYTKISCVVFFYLDFCCKMFALCWRFFLLFFCWLWFCSKRYVVRRFVYCCYHFCFESTPVGDPHYWNTRSTRYILQKDCNLKWDEQKIAEMEEHRLVLISI